MAKRTTIGLVVCCVAVVLLNDPWTMRAQAAGTITVPTDHPRLWWTPARIAAAKTWYSTHSFTPQSDDYIGMATKYVLTGTASACQPAVDWAANFTVASSELSGVASDNARWSGEQAIIVYDWCNALFTSAQKSSMISKWNNYVSTLNGKSWGGPGMESNNYYWGYWRNSFEWGIASYGDNPSAQTYLDYAVTTRWQNGLVPYFAGAGRGGVFGEGSQYGTYMGGYSAIPLQSAALLGRDLMAETNFYKEVIMAMIYQITPQRTPTKSSSSPYYQVMPFDDDEGQQDASRADYGNLMTVLAQKWSAVPLGQYARQWLNTVSPSRGVFAQSTDPGGTALAFSSLPLDYYSPGPGYFFARNKWGSGSTYLQLQAGWYNRTGHVHADQGNFHVWRNGYWLTKETTGYTDSITDWGGSGTTDTEHAPSHNTLFYNGDGPPISYSKGNPTVSRLETQQNYAYLATDLTQAMRASDSRFDNPTASTTVREYLFVRPLETLVILDRMLSSSSTTKAGIAIHFENNPTVNGTKVISTNGTEALEVTSLLSAPTSRVVNEGASGRYRLELEKTGQTQNYFLTVLQARSSTGSSLTATASEDSSTITVTLVHPTLGSAKVVFAKGSTSTGGQFGYSSTTTPPTSLSALATTVASSAVSDTGLSWSGSGATQPPLPPGNVHISD